ncbi:MAG: hypothetical protein CVU00_07890 [Bacteroidetes bacterium HGW-Bacteroidetes-17]|nr:MAG: hypothetical protein CVU00_07890 [Bacteroidetes bacterium HGW-Bacteroidetes-17]
MKKILVLLSVSLLFGFSYGQSIEGNIEVYLNEMVESLPGSNGNDYQVPTVAQLNSWGNMMDAIFDGNIESANGLAASLNYQIIDFQDTTIASNNRFYVIKENSSQIHYWGTYVISTHPLRNNLIIQAPHPVYDSQTGYQAIFCFKRLIPRALFISGTHRCNNSEYSECSGTTTACGPSSPYRISDNAHNSNSVFQKTTEAFFNEFDNSVFLQLHGFAQGTGDPDLIMSNGTRITPSIDYLSLIENAFLQDDPAITFKLAHIDLDWTKLTAFTNTQGRLINKSSDPCYENASSCDGRFIHIEQERTKFRSDSTGWYKMYSALKSAFSIDTITTGIKKYPEMNEIKISPNPSNGYFQFDLERDSKVVIYNCLGAIIYTRSISEPNRLIVDLRNHPSGMYYMQVLQGNKWSNSKIMIIK